MENYIFFGPPGAGKGTQAQKLAKNYNLSHISTGEILRKQIAQKNELGIEAALYMDKGELVPDEIIIKMVEHTILETKKSNGFILDGFPRTIKQAEALDKMLTKNKLKIKNVIMLNVNKKTILNRLQIRAKLENRQDDNIKIIENRIVVYSEKTEPIIKYYEKQNKLITIDGTGEINEIYHRIVNEINL